MRTLQRIALALVIIGAINWGLIGLFQFDLVASIFGGQAAGFSRIIYTLVGISGIISIVLYFNEFNEDVYADVIYYIYFCNLIYLYEYSVEMQLNFYKEFINLLKLLELLV